MTVPDPADVGPVQPYEVERLYRVPSFRVQLCQLADSTERYALTRRSIKGSADVWACFRLLCDLDREHFYVILLDTKHKIIGVNLVAIGTVNSCIVHPREVLKPAILANALALLLVHNHPAGDPTPSAEDLAITTRIRGACDLLGIACLDHIVIGRGRYVSFVDDGYW